MAGNGGSAANANHLATDLIYGVNAKGQGTLRVHSLASNPSVMTCLGNDTGYENIFANQLEALAQPKDLLLVFSGSGNSPNILKLLEVARRLQVTTISFLGFDGGKAKPLSDYPLHFPIHDMQVVEDLHMIAAHLLMKNQSKEATWEALKTGRAFVGFDWMANSRGFDFHLKHQKHL